MTIKRIAALLLAGAAATTALSAISLGSPASAGPVQIQSGCRFELTLLTANELQEANKDEIFLRIGDEDTRTIGFVEDQSRAAGDFGNADLTTEFIPSGGRISVQVWESDWPSADELLGSFWVACTAGSFVNDDDVDRFGSDYDVAYRVIALP